MIDFFLLQIRLGHIAINDVPEQFRDDVSEKLKDGGANNAP